jgi:N-acetylmuramoyl-L-alanine amidase
LIDGRLAVSERFLVERASEFLGQRQSVEPVHGTGAFRVVLDPAHGGADRGSAAAGVAPEKEAVLQLALEAAARLRKKGFEVRLTRDDDRPVTHAERATVANRWQADLFLSLHASGAARSHARGFEVFLADVSPSATSDRLWADGQVGRIGESRRWAEAVRSQVGAALASFDRGIRQMPSPLLEAILAPACLLEAGNLSWPEDAAVFTKPQARGALAAAIAEAAVAFFRTAP